VAVRGYQCLVGGDRRLVYVVELVRPLHATPFCLHYQISSLVNGAIIPVLHFYGNFGAL